jgi:hypothetical protein
LKERLGFSFDYTGGLSRREIDFSIEIANRKLAGRQGKAAPPPAEPMSQEDREAMDKAISDAMQRKAREYR